MSRTLVGYVFKVKIYADGSIDIGFFSNDEEIELHYFSEQPGSTMTKDIANALAETLGRNILSEIHFNDNDISTSVELEEIDSEYDDS